MPNKKDYIYKKMLQNGRIWERKKVNKMMAHIKRGSCVIDVGAHIGSHSIQFSKCAKKVFSFEPMVYNYKIFEKNIELNAIKNTILFKLALSNEIGTLGIKQESANNTGATFLQKDKRGQIAAERLDDIIFNYLESDDSISFIKYDIEDMEYEALLGSEKTLKKFKPILFIEEL